MSTPKWPSFLLALALSCAASVSAFAVPTDITYAEGDANVKFKNGRQAEAEIGLRLNTGDLLKTGRDGLVELDQKGVVLKVSPNTVFTLMEREQKGAATPVLSVALGAIKFRYDKLTGKEPMVQTNGAAMGVRGTEFSVYAGADGSTLVVVDSGAVEVEAEGKTVALAPEEAVEVKLGQAPGEKFAVKRDQVDYSKWNEEKLASMLADPDAAMTNIEGRMASYIASVEEYAALYADHKQRLAEERKKRLDLLQDNRQADAERLENEVITPLAFQTGYLFLNTRYHALAALSLRRYVAGRLYLFMKSRAITEVGDPAWIDFKTRFARLLSSFEQSIVPQMTAADI
jgi:hypothetical protein